MGSQFTEQDIHDQINLRRLVKRLEKSTTDDAWDDTRQANTWIKAQGTLQKVKHARRLLKNVEMADLDPTPKVAQRYHDIRMKLDRIEMFFQAVEKRTTPKFVRPDPILPHIPLPSPLDLPSIELSLGEQSHKTPLEDLQTPSLPTDLLLSPSDTAPLPTSNFLSPVPTLIPPTLPPSSSKSTVTATSTAIEPKFLQNSNALQKELSDQLAQMATQLKRNAIHFSESLAKDKAVVEEAQEKLEGNYDLMTKTRVRVRDLRGKSGSTTCLVMLAVMIVAVSFILMFFVIRFT